MSAVARFQAPRSCARSRVGLQGEHAGHARQDGRVPDLERVEELPQVPRVNSLVQLTKSIMIPIPPGSASWQDEGVGTQGSFGPIVDAAPWLQPSALPQCTSVRVRSCEAQCLMKRPRPYRKNVHGDCSIPGVNCCLRCARGTRSSNLDIAPTNLEFSSAATWLQPLLTGTE